MEAIKTDEGLQVTGNEDSTSEHTVVAALEQLFTGLRVGLPSLEVRCCSCGTQLGEGNQVSVYAYRTVETPRSVSLGVAARTAHRTTSPRQRLVRQKFVSLRG